MQLTAGAIAFSPDFDTDGTLYLYSGYAGLFRSADRGATQLLSYRQLYELWERQHWATQDIDFTQDRIDWHERIDAEERFARIDILVLNVIRMARLVTPIMQQQKSGAIVNLSSYVARQPDTSARGVALRLHGVRPVKLPALVSTEGAEGLERCHAPLAWPGCRGRAPDPASTKASTSARVTSLHGLGQRRWNCRTSLT